MPIRDIDVDGLEVSADVPEKVRKIRSIVLSIIGTILLLTGVIGMVTLRVIYGDLSQYEVSPAHTQVIVFEFCTVGSIVFLFVAFLQHKKNIPFIVFGILSGLYFLWFILAMTFGIPFV